tara:strand:- start:340 stop:777 length:438 start_codon:yes stop_codon:yes gene_type:complete
MTDEIKKRGRGRPRKSDIAAVKPGNKGKVGRPKGDAAIINEYKSRMLASPKSRKVLETIFDAALDNDHKNQASAWKLIMDRMLPVGAFEKEVIKDAGRNSIQINISGVGAIDIADQGDNGVGSMSIEGEGEVVDNYGGTNTTNET